MIQLKARLALLLFVFLGLSSAQQALGSSHLAAVRQHGELVVLTWPHQESIFTRRLLAESGQAGAVTIGGIDIDIMRLFADHLGVNLTVVPVTPDFAALIPKLLAGQGDLVASSMSITAGRKKKIDFSIPYYEILKVVIVLKGSEIEATDDLVGKVAAAVPGTSHEEQLRALLPKNEIRHVQFMLENYTAVAEGEADFTIVNSSSAGKVLGEYFDLGEKLEVAFQFPESDFFGFALAPGSDLKPSLDAFIEEIRRNGELDRILNQHSAPRVKSGGSVD